MSQVSLMMRGEAVAQHTAGSDQDEETVPFVYNSLARKALAGRQSLAHPKVGHDDTTGILAVPSSLR